MHVLSNNCEKWILMKNLGTPALKKKFRMGELIPQRWQDNTCNESWTRRIKSKIQRQDGNAAGIDVKERQSSTNTASSLTLPPIPSSCHLCWKSVIEMKYLSRGNRKTIYMLATRSQFVGYLFCLLFLAIDGWVRHLTSGFGSRVARLRPTGSYPN